MWYVMRKQGSSGNKERGNFCCDSNRGWDIFHMLMVWMVLSKFVASEIVMILVGDGSLTETQLIAGISVEY